MKKIGLVLTAVAATLLNTAGIAQASAQSVKESYYWYTDSSYTDVAGYLLIDCYGNGVRRGYITEYEVYSTEPCT